MILEMRQLALDFLYNELKGVGEAEEWYIRLRENRMEVLLPYLIESAKDSMATNYYVMYPHMNDNKVAVLEQRVFKQEDANRLPFVQSTGSQSASLGPVVKRTFSKTKGSGPSHKILDTTLKAFDKISNQNLPWSSYFSYAHELFSRPVLQFSGNDFEDIALYKAIEIIDERKTAYLSILDDKGRLPGEREDYRKYLQEVLAKEKYSTQKIAPEEGKVDSLTGEKTKVYPNSLAGSGLNLTNADRPGVFPNLLEANAWKKFSLGAHNADLLYTFNFHMRTDFIGKIAGEKALVLPQLSFDQDKRQEFIRKFKTYINNLESGEGVNYREEALLGYYKDVPDAISNITIIWANFGQKLENITGIVSDILPSRLSSIAQKIESLDIDSYVFPKYQVKEVEPDLQFNSLSALLKCPGGKKNQKTNESAKLFEFKRDTVARIYHGRGISMNRFWDEVLNVARRYLVEAAESNNVYGLINEGTGKKRTFLTLASWVKHLAKYIYFFTELGVYETMSNSWSYEPKQKSLKTFFSNTVRTAGLNNEDKVYTFLLGVLFGKVMEVQGARGVNVAANALTWLKRLNMTGADLPLLYNKVREKLLAYETESREEVAAIVEEIGHLGVRIGTPSLNKTDACYYLLLGQSLTKTLIPTKSRADKKGGLSTNE